MAGPRGRAPAWPRPRLHPCGATWDSHANREQLRDGAAILGQLVPAILHLMMRDDAPDLGEVAYPMIHI